MEKLVSFFSLKTPSQFSEHFLFPLFSNTTLDERLVNRDKSLIQSVSGEERLQ